MEPIPHVRSVSFGILVQNGSRDESVSTNGISHFIEHLLFKGTEKRSAKDIADTMDAVGGQLNAFTSKEITGYMARTLDTHFDVALDVLSDMLFNSTFDEAGIEKERGVILEEINMYEDTPESVAMYLLEYNSFKNHPLGMTILGPPENIKTFKRQDFIDFIGNRYRPHNTVIAIAGNINKAEVLEKVATAFSRFDNGRTSSPSGSADSTARAAIKSATGAAADSVSSIGSGAAADSASGITSANPALYQPSFTVRDKDIEQVHLCMGFPGIASSLDSEMYALACVNTVFGGGMSSRLFQTIREEHGLAYSVYSYNASYKDTGVFTIYAGLGPAHIYDVLHLITGEIKRMFTDKITADQLAKTREQIKSSFIMGLESAGNRMSSIGNSLLMMGRTVTPDEIIAKIDAVDLDAFYAMCERIFKLDEMSLSLVGKQVEGMEKGSVLGKI